MFRKIKDSFIGMLITAILMAAIAFLFVLVHGPQASLTLSSVETKDSTYMNTILIKNIQKEEYIKEMELILDSDVKVLESYMNGNKISVKDNVIAFKKVSPKSVVTLTIMTDKKMSQENIKFVKNGQRVYINYFNNMSHYIWYIILIVGFYAILNFLFSVITEVELKKRITVMERELNQAKKQLEKQDSELKDILEKKIQLEEYYKNQIADMQREISIYKDLICKKQEKFTSKEDGMTREKNQFRKRNTRYYKQKSSDPFI